MRIELTGILQSAKGPYGGRANRLKLVTRNDGSVVVTHRKRSMTGDQVHVSHEWAKLQWTWLDATWSGLPQHVRALWGMCARRRTDHARSNQDEFRAINLPRAILGMPALRLPPDRFAAYATYLQRPKEFSRHTTTPPTQVWLHGDQKTEPVDPAVPPPEPPPEPVPPETFDWNTAPIPHPIIASLCCVWHPCPDNADHCYDELYLFMPTPWKQRAGVNFCRWHCPTYGDPPTRDPYWIRHENIYSEQVWYDSEPYYEILHTDVRCETGEYEGTPIPYPSAWCFRLQHISSPGVLLSYGYYWRDTSLHCPNGAYELHKVIDVYGTFPWPDEVTLDPAGTLLTDPPPCPEPEAFSYAFPPVSALWSDLDDPERWAGLTWEMTTPHTAALYPDSCAGPSFVSATNLTCCSEGVRKGLWYFLIVVEHAGTNWLLEYRKVATGENPGCYGHFIHYDPLAVCPWATPAILLYNAYTDWPARVVTPAEVIAYEVGLYIACWVLGILAEKALMRLAAHLAGRTAYSGDLIIRSALAARPAGSALSATSWKCRIVAKHGNSTVVNYEIAKEAIRRLRLLRHVIP